MIGLNDYINASRENRYHSASLKKKQEKIVQVALSHAAFKGTIHKHKKPCELWITFVEKDHRRDLDNISIATKFIQDEMVKFGIFPDDSTKYIKLLHYTVAYDKKHPRIEVEVREVIKDSGFTDYGESG